MSFIAAQKATPSPWFFFSCIRSNNFHSPQTIKSTLQILTLYWYPYFSFHWTSSSIPKITSMHPQSHIYHFNWNPALLGLLFCYGGEMIHTAFLGKPLYLYSESHLFKDVTPAMDPFQPYIINMSSSAGLSSSSS